MKCVAHILRESLYCGFRLCHSVFIGGGHFFRPVVSRVIIFNSNTGGVFMGGCLGRPATVVSATPPATGLMRTHHTPRGYHPQAKDLMFYFISYTKVGVFISFSGCLGLLGLLAGC